MAIVVMRALGGNAVSFYNNGKESGHSKSHKHLQILPEIGLMRQLPLFKGHALSQPAAGLQLSRLPFFKFRHGFVAWHSQLEEEL